MDSLLMMHHKSVQDDYYEVEKADRTADHLMSEKDHAETDQERVKQEDPMYLKVMGVIIYSTKDAIWLYYAFISITG